MNTLAAIIQACRSRTFIGGVRAILLREERRVKDRSLMRIRWIRPSTHRPCSNFLSTSRGQPTRPRDRVGDSAALFQQDAAVWSGEFTSCMRGGVGYVLSATHQLE